MDLRGFSAAHAGCVFELGVLIDTGALGRVALLVDRTTDEPFLQSTLRDFSQRAEATSEGSQALSQLRLLRVDAGPAAAVLAFMATFRQTNDEPTVAPPG